MDELSDKLRSFLEQKEFKDAILLIKADKRVTTQELITVCNLARNAGFSGIQIATEK